MVKSVNRAAAGPDAAGGVAQAAGGEAADDGRGSGGADGPAARVPLRELMDDRLLDALLERSRDEAGGLRLTGEGSMLGELVKAVPARARTG
jgi:putative transposase